MFFKRHVLIKVCPGENSLPSGTVTSLTNSARSQGLTLSAGVRVVEGWVGRLVSKTEGGVDVIMEANWVVSAETVWAAAVLAKSPVGVSACPALGKLQPELTARTRLMAR